MTSIKIDFAEEVSVDTILTPVFDKEQKCIGGLLYDGKKPEKKKYVPVPEMISLVQGYTRLLCLRKRICLRLFWPNLRFQDDAGRLCFGVSDL